VRRATNGPRLCRAEVSPTERNEPHLVDANGTVRHIEFGEGNDEITERLIRQLLSQADTNVSLPPVC
jgi:hypothetical protein